MVNFIAGKKSLLASMLEAKIAVLDARPDASVIIIDVSALINALSSRASKMFEEYANKDVIQLSKLFLLKLVLKSFGLPLVKERTSDGYQYMTVETILALTKRNESLSSTPVLDVMLYRLSVEKVKIQHGKSGMFILKLQTVVFANLSTPVIGDGDKKVLERFVILMSDKCSKATDTDSVRLDLFARKQRAYDAIPTTSAALEYHTKRAAYLFHLNGWGWKQQDSSWTIIFGHHFVILQRAASS